MPVQVPGFTHPVTDMYLEDILKLIGYQDALLGASATPARLNGHSKPHHAGALPHAGHYSFHICGHIAFQALEGLCCPTCGHFVS